MQNRMNTKKKSRKWIAVVVIIGLLSAVALGAAGMLKGSVMDNFYETKTSKGTIETFYTFSGSVGSKDSQMVMAERIMQIAEIKVEEGDKITKDTVLFKTSDGLEVKARINGSISKIYVTEDQQVMAGAQLCDIYDFDNLQVHVKVDEYDINSVTVDKKVDVVLAALDKTVSGTVSKVTNTAVNQNGVAYFTATIDLDKDSAIKIGMTAEAKILNRQVKDVITLPMKAISYDNDDKPYVYVVTESGGKSSIPVQKTIETGLDDGKTMEVINGLVDGQRVVYPKPGTSATTGGFMPPIPKA